MKRFRSERQGFTLIELLIVVVIIGVLVALLLPVVGAAIKRTREAQVTSEINGLATALQQFKTRYGDYPPSRVYLNESGYFPVGSTATLAGNGTTDVTLGALASRSLQYLRKFFPRAPFRIDQPAFQAGSSAWFDFDGNGVMRPYNANDPLYGGTILEGHQCLVWFLGGVPEVDPVSGAVLGVSGFGKNPMNPFSNHIRTDPRYNNGPNPMYSETRSTPFYDFKANRLIADPNHRNGFVGYYDTLGVASSVAAGTSPLNFFAYFSSYGGSGYDPNDVNFVESDNNGVSPLTCAFNSDSPVYSASGSASRIAISPSPNPYTTSLTLGGNGVTAWQNRNTFQIISAGADGVYGVGGYFSPASDSERIPLDTKNKPYNSSDGALRLFERDNLTNLSNNRLD